MQSPDMKTPELRLCLTSELAPRESAGKPLHRPEITTLCRGMHLWVIAADPSVRFRMMVMIQSLGASGYPESSLTSAMYGEVLDHVDLDAALIVMSQQMETAVLEEQMMQLRDLGFEGAYLCLQYNLGMKSQLLPPVSGCERLDWPISVTALGEALIAIRPVDDTARMAEQLSAHMEQTVTSDLSWCPTTAFMLSRFVDNLPGRLDEIQKAFTSRDLDHLYKLTHQLKTSATSHGYRPVSQAVQEIEAILEEQNAHIDQTQQSLEQVTRAIDELSKLCNRVSHLPGHEPEDLPTGA